MREDELKKAIGLLQGAKTASFPEAARLHYEAGVIVERYAGCGNLGEAVRCIKRGSTANAIAFIRRGLAR